MNTDRTPSWGRTHRGLPPAILTAFHETIWVRADGDRYRSTKVSADANITYPVHAFSELDTPLWPAAPANAGMPDLSAWCPVPVGVTIPSGTRYATLYDDGDIAVLYAPVERQTWEGDPPRFTPEPIVDPDLELIDVILSADSVAEAKAALAKVRGA